MATRRRRQGGSAARRAAVANAAIVHHPENRRGIPIMEVTNQEGVELIHDFAMRVAEEIGCDFQDQESLDYWRQTGAEIDGERVRIGREELLELGRPAGAVLAVGLAEHQHRRKAQPQGIGGPHLPTP